TICEPLNDTGCDMLRCVTVVAVEVVPEPLIQNKLAHKMLGDLKKTLNILKLRLHERREASRDLALIRDRGSFERRRFRRSMGVIADQILGGQLAGAHAGQERQQKLLAVGGEN